MIKTIKRRAYGYRNMDYFKLKIMQVCGLLNSNYMKTQANQESMALTNLQQGRILATEKGPYRIPGIAACLFAKQNRQ